MSERRGEYRLALLCWGTFAGILFCAVSYWQAVTVVQRAFDVPSFPPGGVDYWLCWAAPLVAVATVGAVALIVWRRARLALAGFLVAFLLTGLCMGMFGYSVDSMPYYM
ncbi:hypothetical protein [Rhodococcus sp. B50]|uniref:hypothetical protein n=1 Tax=Rhodococcus sp. B50 TaxID=2682847 RepID=UPI001A04B38B|nr:hypothetical protein [Rhodococcus sp. B50]MBS9376612.1 hypothetical protein [Rhodococcus sp. B50]